MDRRHFLTGLLAAGALGRSAPSVAVQSQGAVNVVEAFGFVPDGRTDNYAAFHRWAAHVNRVRGGDYLFPPGTYRVHRVRTRDQTVRDPREVISSQISGCDGLGIFGPGAKIELNGRFHRSLRTGDMSVFMPFEIRHSRNVRISGFEMDGGVRGMTRDPDAYEAYSYLIALHACSGVVLEDLFLHHGQTDAILLSDDVTVTGRGRGIACRDVVLNRVRCHNNARGGLAPIHVLGLRCVDCSFSGNGFGLGNYLAHAPGFGVDVEPDRWRENEVDTRTGNLEFIRCDFSGNHVAFMAPFIRTYRGYLRLIDCTSSNAGGAANHMLINWAGALVQGGVHDAGPGAFWLSWQGETGGDLTVRDCELRCSGNYGVHHPADGNIARLERVRIVATGNRRAPGPIVAIYANPGGGRHNSVRECEIFLPAARKAPDHPYDVRVMLANTVSENNLFRTDLPAAGGQHFATDYGGRTVVRGDRYAGTAPGPNDSFRPGYNSSWDTRRPVSL